MQISPSQYSVDVLYMPRFLPTCRSVLYTQLSHHTTPEIESFAFTPRRLTYLRTYLLHIYIPPAK